MSRLLSNVVPDSHATDDVGERGPFTFAYPTEEDDQPTVAVVEAVSWVRDVPVHALEPLHWSVDTDELEAIFGPGGATHSPSSESPLDRRCLSFQYEGCHVTVTPDRIRIERD